MLQTKGTPNRVGRNIFCPKSSISSKVGAPPPLLDLRHPQGKVPDYRGRKLK